MLTVFPIPTNIDYTASAMHAFYTFIGMFGIAKKPDINEGKNNFSNNNFIYVLIEYGYL